VLNHALAGDFELVLPEIVILEARRHVARDFPEFRERFERLLAALAYDLAPLPDPEAVASATGLVRQQEDIPVALSVIRAQVDYFVTYDRDFTDDHESTALVRGAIPGICLPPVFLRDVMGWTSEELESIRGRTWADLNPDS
jgi:predicted nucleic acid-binding protein